MTGGHKVATILATASAIVLLWSTAIGAATIHWTIEPTPSPSTAGYDTLYGVSCPTTTYCVAVGNSLVGPGVSATLAEVWDGESWSVMTTPNPSSSAVLEAVSCTSTTNCVAVGLYVNDEQTAGFTLVETWNGTTWSIVPSPNKAVQNNYLTSVSCVSASMCVATGETAQGAYGPLAEVWDGTSWTLTPDPVIPPGGSNDTVFSSVSCTTPRRCMAVGESENHAFVAAWNGSQWRDVPTPTPGAGTAWLHGVSCTRPSSCVAVGYVNDGGIKMLFDQWDGSVWSATEGISPGRLTSNLYAVSCVRAGRCIAVGPKTDRAGGGGLAQWKGLSESWDGSAATLLRTPQAGQPDHIEQLNGVSCPSTRICIAVGTASSHRETKAFTLVGQ